MFYYLSINQIYYISKYFKTILRYPVLSKHIHYLNSPESPGSRSRSCLEVMGPTKSIKDLGYAFNADGKLRKIDAVGKAGEESFQFSVSDNHQECQKHYEELGEAVTEYVYQLLEQDEKLIRLPVPKGSSPENGTFIFVSKDYEKKDKLLVMIHGSGVVRAGQWARSLIINDSIKTGTQIPYIKKAIEKKFGIVILNTNDNYRGDSKKILKSSNAEEHASYVWDTYITNTKASSIAIVAHSYGGVVCLHLANKFEKDFEKRVKAVAFTDSVHGFSNLKVTKDLKQIARNWVSSGDPLDSAMKTPDYDIERVSAGHPKHEMTSYSCINSVFKFLDHKISYH